MLTLALLMLTQDGDVRWIKEFDDGLKSAARTRRPVLIYFYCDWGPCVKMGQGPLSDPDLVAAIGQLTPVQVNVKADAKNVCGKYGITKPCNFVFAAVDGEKIETYEGEKEVRPMVQRIGEILKKHPRDLPWEASAEAALEKAAKQDRLVVLMFVGKNPAQVPLLLDNSLEELRGKLLFVKLPAKSELAEKYAVKSADTMVVLDAEGAEKARIAGKKPVKTLKKELEALFK